MNIYYDECGLFRGTYNKLYQMGFETREQILQGVLSGKIRPRGWVRNYGEKTHEEVCKWLGIEAPEKPPKNQCVCPNCGAKFIKQ